MDNIIDTTHMSYGTVIGGSPLPVGTIRRSRVLQGGYTTGPVITEGAYLAGGPFTNAGVISESIAHSANAGFGGTRIVGSPITTGAVVGGYRGGLTTGLATTGLVSPAPIYNKAVVEEIPTESRIEYVPYEKR